MVGAAIQVASLASFFKMAAKSKRKKQRPPWSILFICHLPDPPYFSTSAANFATGTAGVVDTGGKFFHRCQ
jgi:hypothetical protein